MLNPINLLLLYGGKSGEHEVSLVSAASVLANLDPVRYRVIPVGMDKEGRFYLDAWFQETRTTLVLLKAIGLSARRKRKRQGSVQLVHDRSRLSLQRRRKLKCEV